MKLETRLEKLETRAAPQGHCPHLPPIVRYFDSDGTETTYSEPQGQSEAERGATCECGRERLQIHVNCTAPENMPKAADLTDDELAAIIVAAFDYKCKSQTTNASLQTVAQFSPDENTTVPKLRGAASYCYFDSGTGLGTPDAPKTGRLCHCVPTFKTVPKTNVCGTR